MWTRINRHRLIVAVALLSLAFAAGGRVRAAEDAQLSNEAFWHLITDFSEAGGFFRFDNFISNEALFQHVLGRLKETTKPGGVYLGVGPDQNFTYIVALRPRIAFIVDIRRQNMIEHLMYKALIELSADRAEFLSRLFSRPRPEGLDRNSSIGTLFDAFQQVDADSKMFDENLIAIKDRLIKQHGFKLSSDDEASIAYVFRAFFIGGPNLGYSNVTFPVRPAAVRILPTYEELMIDTDESGQQRSYLATEENFLTLQQIEKNNLIVPLVGNFAGPSALRAVGQYLREHSTSVSAFYT